MSNLTPLPYSPAVQAARLWNVSTVNTVHAVPEKRCDDVSIPKMHNYAGLNINPEAETSAFWDPRSAVAKTVLEHTTDSIGLTHGPSAFDPCIPVQPKVQYGNQGPLIMSAIPLTNRTKPCVCFETCQMVWPYSLASEFYTVRNAIQVRKLLQGAGAVLVSDTLEASVPLCICSVFGDYDEFQDGLLTTAQQYNDTPIIKLLNPYENLVRANVQYVQTFVSTVGSDVNASLRYNYAKVEGNRATLQEYPSNSKNDPMRCDDLFADRALADPRALPKYKAQLSCLTGLPLMKK